MSDDVTRWCCRQRSMHVKMCHKIAQSVARTADKQQSAPYIATTTTSMQSASCHIYAVSEASETLLSTTSQTRCQRKVKSAMVVVLYLSCCVTRNLSSCGSSRLRYLRRVSLFSTDPQLARARSRSLCTCLKNSRCTCASVFTCDNFDFDINKVLYGHEVQKLNLPCCCLGRWFMPLSRCT